ncbi:phosphohydrolase, partial [bacterium]|nr:phosphohydrolase [bacterium]
YNGKGYPDGLSGENIPLGARILAVADAYDAMKSDRPYRRALTEETAIQELKRGSGTQFDSKIVEIFLEILKTKS